MDYFDFDLHLSAAANGYRARATNAQGANVSADFALPFAAYEIENLFLRVGRPRRGVRKIESDETKAAKAFGGKLFDAVFTGEVFGLWRSSFNTAIAQGKGLRLRLRLTETPELLDLPWEFLYDNTRNQFVALLTKTPVVRFMDLPTPIQPLKTPLPLRVLVVISDPTDYEPLDVEREWANVRRATRNLETRGAVNVTRLSNATRSELRRALRQNEYHVLHFIGHGKFVEDAQDGVLIFKNEQGRGERVSSQMLAQVLVNFDSLRLVILNACEGARTSRNDPFAGVAPSLVQKNKPAVIAMQFEVSDGAAITFADEFYSALAAGDAVDTALTHARNAIWTDVNDLEWGTPVLYMRAPDGVIFETTKPIVMPLTPRPEPEPKVEPSKPANPKPHISTEELDDIYTAALSAFHREKWEQAKEGFTKVVAARPDYEDAAQKLKIVTHYLQASKAFQNKNWAEAIVKFEQLLEIEPRFQDAEQKLADAHRLAKEEEVETRQREEQKVAETKRRVELQDLYSRAVKAMNASDWETAWGLFFQLQITEPGYRDIAELLARVGIEMIKDSRHPSIIGRDGKEMMFIPAGEFVMGSKDISDAPPHKVYLGTYYIARYPVTNAEYKKFVDETGYQSPTHWYRGLFRKKVEIPNGKENHPVVNVSWNDAVAYCKWAGGWLPTEAEWEKAASWDLSQNKRRVFPWGDTFDANKCNSKEAGIGDTTPVGKYSSRGDSFYGVGDMAGNVWEWCADWFQEEYYSSSPRENPRNDTSSQYRVLRGGAFSYGSDLARCAFRYRRNPDFRSFYRGFRVAVSPA